MLAPADRIPQDDRLLTSRANVPSGGAWWLPHVDSPSAALAAQRESEGRTAFGALVVFTFILLLAPQNWIPALAPLRIAFLTAGAAVVSLLLDHWKQRKPLALTREMLLCLALPTWAFLTLPLSYWPSGSLAALTDYIKAVTVFWLLATVVTTIRR